MPESVIAKIETFIASQTESGEFVSLPRDASYHVIAAVVAPTKLLYMTKMSAFRAKLLPALPLDCSVVSRYGLPASHDVSKLGRLSVSLPISFLGDLDPVDLLNFAWLRAKFPAGKVHLAGIRDRLLQELTPAEKTQCLIDFDPSEVDAMPLLYEVLPDLADLIGPESYELIKSHRKIELEGLINLHEWQPDDFYRILFG